MQGRLYAAINAYMNAQRNSYRDVFRSTMKNSETNCRSLELRWIRGAALKANDSPICNEFRENSSLQETYLV